MDSLKLVRFSWKKSYKKDALWQTFIGALCEAVGGTLRHSIGSFCYAEMLLSRHIIKMLPLKDAFVISVCIVWCDSSTWF